MSARHLKSLFPGVEAELAALGTHMKNRREAILYAWRREVRKDPELSTANSLPRVQLNDHIPLLLIEFERRLNPGLGTPGSTPPDAEQHAEAHGLHRWQQGYDLRELAQELGRLNECVVVELEAYGTQDRDQARAVMATARWMWADLSAHEFTESIGEYFRLQQVEAAGHLKDLEQALNNLQELEQQRAALWHEAAHDLRGNLGVVVNATAGLINSPIADSAQANFLRLLDRNVRSLRQLLDEVTDLARLQAGKERLQSAQIDVAPLLIELCNDLRSQAEGRGLFLRCGGPDVYVVEGDSVKIRRIAQNLAVNAIKYTREGGITISWGESEAYDDAKRWVLCVEDSGPGFDAGPGAPLVVALGEGTDLAHQADEDAVSESVGGAAEVVPPSLPEGNQAAHQEPGEGIGLSIVKRLTELLHASVEVQSAIGKGTKFRVHLPKEYPR